MVAGALPLFGFFNPNTSPLLLLSLSKQVATRLLLNRMMRLKSQNGGGFRWGNAIAYTKAQAAARQQIGGCPRQTGGSVPSSVL
jgi:hypothetical protein